MRLKNLVFIIVISAFWIVACKDDSDKPGKTDVKNPVEYDGTPYVFNAPNMPPSNLPQDNQLTQQKIQLGRMLFYEKQLSADGSQSCASCHRQEHAFTDTSKFSIGVQGLPGKRQAMAIFNMAWHSNEFFWDGRAHLLRDQSLFPIQDELEMNETLERVIAKLEGEQKYRDQFIRAFGDDTINSERISLALEQFMNTILSIRSNYDLYLAGEYTLSPSEERGRKLFFAEFNPGFPDLSGADCAHCHTGRTFENDLYMNNGLDHVNDMQDSGRAAVTGLRRDLGSFKVVSLRNIELTPPYMHDGRFTTLMEVVEHYNSGIKGGPSLDPTLANVRHNGGLGLSQQDKLDLVAFMKTLTDLDLMTNPEYSDPH